MEEITHASNYLASYIAAFMSGEILLIPIIISAKLGYLNFYGAMITAMAGTLTRDWCVFLLFKKRGRQILHKNPTIKTRLLKVERFFVEKPIWIFCIYRLMFGMVSLIVIGLALSQISNRRFAVLSLISNSVFIFVLGSAGYFFTELLSEKIHWIHEHKIFLAGGIVLLGFVYYFFKNKIVFQHLRT